MTIGTTQLTWEGSVYNQKILKCNKYAPYAHQNKPQPSTNMDYKAPKQAEVLFCHIFYIAPKLDSMVQTADKSLVHTYQTLNTRKPRMDNWQTVQYTHIRAQTHTHTLPPNVKFKTYYVYNDCNQ
jgi:hypothetical protein